MIGPDEKEKITTLNSDYGGVIPETTVVAHSRLAPSSAERWVHCPGSIVMQERYPQNEESEASREGTASHWVASEVLLLPGSDCKEYIGKTAPNGVIISEEMAEGAGIYVQDVLSTMDKIGATYDQLNIETRVDIHKIHTESWGTPDAWLFDPKSGLLYVWDYKYGRRVVSPIENWQLISYTVGIFAFLFKRGVPEMHNRVNMRVVQPRTYTAEGPIRVWETFYDMLRAQVNTLQDKAIEALSDDPSTVSGPWCRDCTARHPCRTYQQAAMQCVDLIGDLSADELSPDAIGTELAVLTRAADVVKYRLEALQAHAIQLIVQGKPIQGWTTQEGKGRKKWDRPNTEVFTLGDLMGVNLRKDPEPITPQQAINLGLDAAIVNTYSTIPSSGLKLLPDDGSRAKLIFSQPQDK